MDVAAVMLWCCSWLARSLVSTRELAGLSSPCGSECVIARCSVATTFLGFSGPEERVFPYYYYYYL